MQLSIPTLAVRKSHWSFVVDGSSTHSHTHKRAQWGRQHRRKGYYHYNNSEHPNNESRAEANEMVSSII